MCAAFRDQLGDLPDQRRASCVPGQERLAGTRYLVADLDLSEYAKGTGGPNCLIMPVDRS
jgi:N-dimethylarginine dimethylaminohydrolase